MRPRRRPALLGVLLTPVLVAALAACTDTGGSAASGTTTTTTRTVARARPSAGCAHPAAAATQETIDVAGAPRRYLVSRPEDPRRPAPLVLDLHGLGSPAEVQAAYSELPELGAAAGAIVVTPASDNAANSWQLPQFGPKDSDFMRAILDRVEANRCVDRAREVAAGISNGAGLADGLVCALDGRLAAIFPVAGVNILRPCPTAKPTTIVAFHGTADGLIPYAGGKLFSGIPGGFDNPRLATLLPPAVRGLYERIQLEPVESVVAGWAQQFHCGPAEDRSVGPGVRLRSYRRCTDRTSVRLYTIEGGGHTWPGARVPVERLGATTQTISATQIILDTLPTVARSASPTQAGDATE